MKNIKRFSLKILSGIIAITIIVLIVSITNSFLGNPISKMIAHKAISKYVQEKYPDLDLVVGKVSYNFKYGEYVAKAESKKSIDTNFAVYCKAGKVKRDDYETYVLGKYNTLIRLQDEYEKLIIPILSKLPGLENNTSMVEVEKWEYEKGNENIKLDMKFDKNIKMDMQLHIRAGIKDSSLENITKILENSHKVLRENGCVFTSYSVFSENQDTFIMINGVTPLQIEGGELLKLLEEAKQNENANGISVNIKGEKK